MTKYDNHPYNNCVIEVLDEDHGKKVIEWWEKQGVDNLIYRGDCTKKDNRNRRYYGLKNEVFGHYELTPDLKLITLPTEYPKVMWVWDDNEENAYKRVVFMEKCGKYITWNYAESIEDAEKEVSTTGWRHAKDIEPDPQPIELTINEIANKFGVAPELIKIKK